MQERIQPPARERLYELDGIRGWAALSVVFHHIYWWSLAPFQPGIRNVFDAFVLDGPLDVYIFFILSGVALSFPVLERDGDGLAGMVLRRYPRLVFPIIAAALLAVAAMSLNLVYVTKAAKLNGWFLTMLDFQPSWLTAIDFGLRGAFIGSTTNYNTFLWTMPIELSGSFLLFGLLAFYPRVLNKGRFAVMACVPIFAMFPSMFCFVFGMVVASAEHEGLFLRLRNHKLWQLLNWSALFVIVWIVTDRQLKYNYFPDEIFNVVTASILIVLVLTNNATRKFFRLGISRILGKLSFSLYLMHFLVITTYTSHMIVERAGALSMVRCVQIGFWSVCICILAACCFYPIENFAHVVAKKIANLVMLRDSRRPANV